MPILAPGSGLEGLTIAFLSDIHAGLCMSKGDLCEIFERVSFLSPDLVCLGGDLINTREREILLFREPLSLIKPPLGVFCVPGNHDHFWGPDIGLWESFLVRQGVEVLNNRGKRIEKGGENLFLAGVDDLTEGSPCLESALNGRRSGEPTILLSHHPDFFFEAAANDVDLTLSGHTHGGQIRFFGWSPIHHSRFGWVEGKYELEGARLYVGRGVGTTALPIRIGTRAEIPLITLSERNESNQLFKRTAETNLGRGFAFQDR
jgi:predicted MPP superfamily phosphohydrolase